MQNERLIYLFHRHFKRESSPEEKKELLQLAEDPANEQALRQLIQDTWDEPLPFYSQPSEKADEIFSYILNYQPVQRPVHRVHFLKTSWFRYAAAVVLLIGGIMVWRQLSQPLSSPTSVSSSLTKISPGTNRAVLTIGNKTIDLATNKTGIAVGNVITYTDGERIADASKMLTLSTPRGGQYRVMLPDGSTVWLNAASSIKFPSKFLGDKRAIEITGEAYLEIAKNAKQPFYVTTRKTTIQVLGTSFNIKAYADDESEETTLIEGSVKINSSLVLQPGQQTIISSADVEPKVISDVNLKEVTAWINGLFVFAGRSIEDVMKDISRWYDVDIVYEGEMPVLNMGGTISKQQNIDQILNLLELTEGVHFKVEGRKVIVIAGSAE